MNSYTHFCSAFDNKCLT